jgi:hypothetical protein
MSTELDDYLKKEHEESESSCEQESESEEESESGEPQMFTGINKYMQGDMKHLMGMLNKASLDLCGIIKKQNNVNEEENKDENEEENENDNEEDNENGPDVMKYNNFFLDQGFNDVFKGFMTGLQAMVKNDDQMKVSTIKSHLKTMMDVPEVRDEAQSLHDILDHENFNENELSSEDKLKVKSFYVGYLNMLISGIQKQIEDCHHKEITLHDIFSLFSKK